MKKLLNSFILIICGIFLTLGCGILLSACNPDSGRGGGAPDQPSVSQPGDLETPEQGDDAENPETGDGLPSEGGETNTPSEDGGFSDDNEGDSEVGDNGWWEFRFTINFIGFKGSTTKQSLKTNSDNLKMNITWKDDGGSGAEIGRTYYWAYGATAETYENNSGSSFSNITYAKQAKSDSGLFVGSPYRYIDMLVKIDSASAWRICGVKSFQWKTDSNDQDPGGTLSNSSLAWNSYCRSNVGTSGTSPYYKYQSYLYGEGSSTTSEQTAKDGCSNAVRYWDYYVYFRYQYTNTWIYGNGSSNTTSTNLCGVGYNTKAAPSARTGYAFKGWKNSKSGKIYSANAAVSDADAVSAVSWTAIWLPNTYGLTYNANGGTISGSSTVSDTVRYGDAYGKYNLYSVSKNTYSYSNGDFYVSNSTYGVIHLTKTSTTSSTTWANFFQPFDWTFAPSTKYTVILRMASLNDFSSSGISPGVFIASPSDGGGNQDVSTGYVSFNPANYYSIYKTTFTTQSSLGSQPYNLRSFVSIPACGSNLSLQFIVYVCVGDVFSDVNNISYPNQGVNTPLTELPTPTRIHYDFAGWWTKNGTSSGDWGTQVTASTVVSATAAHTLYAKWTPHVYSYTITYADENSSLSSAISLSVSEGTIGSDSLVVGESTVWQVPYQTDAAFLNLFVDAWYDMSYPYYISSTGLPTSKTYETIGEAQISWTPDHNASINIYITQAFYTTFDANGGSGTAPEKMQVARNEEFALPINNLTWPSYVANGWNTQADTLGTAYADGRTMSINGDLKLYASYTPQYVPLTVKVVTSEDGSTWTDSFTGGVSPIGFEITTWAFGSEDSDTAYIDRTGGFVLTGNSLGSQPLINTDIKLTSVVAAEGYIWQGTRLLSGTL
ncbi:MAG: InlB B-repeat-containing protein, partial [Clostridia bacterium]|nr:InlB B-repeat-containing protein [Clostridia bacterium]